MDFIDLDEEDLIAEKPNALIATIEGQDYDIEELVDIFVRAKREIEEQEGFKRYVGEKIANIAFDNEDGVVKTKHGTFKPRRNGVRKVWPKDRALEAAFQGLLDSNPSPRDVLNFISENFSVSTLEKKLKKLGLKPEDYYKETGEAWWTVDQK